MFPLFRINRAQLLDDALNLGRADLLDYPTALKVTEYLTLETDFIPWSAAVTGLAYLEDMMKRSAGFGELRHYLLATLQPLYDRLGFQEVEGEKFLDEKLRIIMLEVRCGGGTCPGHVAACAGAVPPGPRGVQRVQPLPGGPVDVAPQPGHRVSHPRVHTGSGHNKTLDNAPTILSHYVGGRHGALLGRGPG